MSITQPMKMCRLTWDELMSRRGEIAPDAMLGVKVFEPEPVLQVDAENQALISLLQSWREEDSTHDAQQLAQWKAEAETLMDNLQANRISLRGTE